MTILYTDYLILAPTMLYQILVLDPVWFQWIDLLIFVLFDVIAIIIGQHKNTN